MFWVTLIVLVYGFLNSSTVLENQLFQSKVFAVADTGILSENTILGITENYILDEILFILLIISGLIYAFSKEKIEDEMVRSSFG